MKTISAILQKIRDISKPQKKFIESLFSSMLILKGRINFTNMGRFSHYSERTIRRHFSKTFNFVDFNYHLLKSVLKNTSRDEIVAAMDCSFVRKSGKHTYGVGWYWSGSHNKTEKGLEVSSIAIVDQSVNTAYNLSVVQTPSDLNDDETRIDYYLAQLKKSATKILHFTKYLAVDGYYAKTKFITSAINTGLEIITKLRVDANLHLIHEGPQEKRRGPKRKYGKKINFNDLTDLEFVGYLEDTEHKNNKIEVYTQIAYHKSFKRKLRIVVLYNKNKQSHCTLASTDLDLDHWRIIRLYKSRFQIEFLFRDAKQHTGLEECQSRKKEALDFHFNVSLSAVGLVKAEILAEHQNKKIEVFSIDDFKRRLQNIYMIHRVIDILEIKPQKNIKHPRYQEIINFGRMRA